MAATGSKTLESKPSLPEELPLDYMRKITNDFSDERQLCTGAFGSVYKGILEDGREVAVKKLEENSPVHSDFAKEVHNIMVLEHENIVKMKAFCREAQNKLVQSSGRYIIAEITDTVLCSEYFPKGSLDKHIFGESTTIDWNTRFKIIKGISCGIQYLHSLGKPVLHLGLNPQSVWLDDNMVPKIADFGFSRIFGEQQTRVNTKSQLGAIGYMAPEYLYRGEISAQSDIYSLGLIIMEITTREKNSCTGRKYAEEYIEGVKNNWTLEKMMDEYPELDYEDGISQVQACIKISLQCVEIDQKKRPSINEIVNKLNGL